MLFIILFQRVEIKSTVLKKKFTYYNVKLNKDMFKPTCKEKG